jgi:phosphopantothenoylcysteine decarboxylase/phosphopantothenate--cysteine ligase
MARAAAADAVIMAAAVADYTPARVADQKVRKGAGTVTLVLTRTPDILADLGAMRRGESAPVLVGFAAETEEVVARAKEKLRDKRADLIVANDVSRSDAGFDVETNAVTMVSADGAETLPLQAKSRVAAEILDRVERMLTRNPANAGSHI